MLLWWAIGALTLALLGWWGVFSTRRIMFPERPIVFPPNPLTPYTTHTLSSPDGGAFDVWRVEVSNPRARLLMFHGYHANRYQILGIGAGLRARGYESLLIELRGHGSRPGPCTFGLVEREDAAAVLAWARELPDAQRVPIAVLGLSMGATLACQVAFAHPDVRAVVADSIYSHFYEIVRYSIKRRYHLPEIPWVWVTWWSLLLALRQNPKACDPASIAPKMRQPLLAIHGGKDDVAPLSQADELYELWSGPKERWVEDDAGHVELSRRDPEAYCNRVAQFLDRTLTAGR